MNLINYCSTFAIVLSVSLFSSALFAQEKTANQIGEVVSDNGSIAKLLEQNSLDGISAWLQVKASELEVFEMHKEEYFFKEFQLTGSYFNRCGAIFESYTEVSRLGVKVISLDSDGTRVSVRGANELAEVVNRPLTGLGVNRTRESRIVQLRHQLSDSISRSEALGTNVKVCIGQTIVCDPKFAVLGFPDKDAVISDITRLLKDTPLTIEAVIAADETGSYLVETSGCFVLETEYRNLHESSPPSAFARSFYLGEKSSKRNLSLGELVKPSTELLKIHDGYLEEATQSSASEVGTNLSTSSSE